MVKYLLILPTLLLFSSFPDQDDLAASMQRGEELYMELCVQCHLPDGTGLEGVNPPLAQADYLLENTDDAIRGVKYGQQGKIVVNGVEYNSYMADPGLEDAEIADVMNFILHSFGNESELIVTEAMVSEIEPW